MSLLSHFTKISSSLFVVLCSTRLLLAQSGIESNDSPAPELLELRDLDVSEWDCLDRPEGSGKTPDGAELNRMKNREPAGFPTTAVKSFDTVGFLKRVALYDNEITEKHRSELSAAQKERLAAFEKQVVSLTGWLVLSYAGPPESTNCGNPLFVDWHLELFEKPSDHPPAIGDPTPIICEITPRTERNIYRDNVRVQAISGFFRLFRDLSIQPTGHKAREVRVTGYLLWDDEHNGKADIGEKIENFSANKYHHPWRSTAWEIHPVLKVETLTNPPAQ